MTEYRYTGDEDADTYDPNWTPPEPETPIERAARINSTPEAEAALERDFGIGEDG